MWCAGIEGTILGGVTILPGYSADTAVPIDAIIDLTRADTHDPNQNEEDNEVRLVIESNEVEEEVGVDFTDNNADEIGAEESV